MSKRLDRRALVSWAAAAVFVCAAIPAFAQDAPAQPAEGQPPAAAEAKLPGALAGAKTVSAKKLDEVYRQIVIEALVVEVDSTTARAWGIDWFYTRNESGEPSNSKLAGVALTEGGSFPNGAVPNLNTGTNPPSVGATNRPIGIGGSFDGFKADSGVVQTQVRAAVGQGKANILSQPIAVARSGQTVTLATVDEIPFQDIQTADNSVATLDVNQKKVGITLTVVPELRPKQERVVLDIKKLDVGQLNGFQTVRGVARPIIQKSELSTKVDLANNESLLISGIKATRDVKQRRGIPLLKDIPVLGYLFGSAQTVQQRVDILFMMTPHVLDPGDNPVLPREFKNRDFGH